MIPSGGSIDLVSALEMAAGLSEDIIFCTAADPHIGCNRPCI